MSAARPVLSGLLSHDRKALPSVTSCTAGRTAGAIVPAMHVPGLNFQQKGQKTTIEQSVKGGGQPEAN